MILRNYDNILAYNALPNRNAVEFPGEKVFGDGYLACKLTHGTVANPQYYNGYSPLSMFSESSPNSSANSYSNLICGSGDTEVTYDDYKLASPFTTKELSSVSGVHKVSEPVYDEETNTMSISYTRNFLANENVTVREIGIHYTLKNVGEVLIYRKVLENPIEVTAGNQFSLTFTAFVPINPNKPANYEATASVE
ncbi:MAG: hypothetical protein E7529_05720 [Ruminococcaceae bacterium]|nr:hypothetical protein [Oscillospiraceae bacterium]